MSASICDLCLGPGRLRPSEALLDVRKLVGRRLRAVQLPHEALGGLPAVLFRLGEACHQLAVLALEVALGRALDTRVRTVAMSSSRSVSSTVTWRSSSCILSSRCADWRSCSAPSPPLLAAWSASAKRCPLALEVRHAPGDDLIDLGGRGGRTPVRLRGLVLSLGQPLSEALDLLLGHARGLRSGGRLLLEGGDAPVSLGERGREPVVLLAGRLPLSLQRRLESRHLGRKLVALSLEESGLAHGIGEHLLAALRGLARTSGCLGGGRFGRTQAALDVGEALARGRQRAGELRLLGLGGRE